MNVFISYRRADSEVVAGRIYDRLVRHFEGHKVFKDVDSIKPGDSFPDVLSRALGECEAILVLIGERWLAAHRDGGRRLDAANDFVRLEIENAMNRAIRIVPVLLGSAVMPEPDELPPSLRPLASRHAIRVRPDPDFHRDMDRVLLALESSSADAGEMDTFSRTLPRGAIGARLKLHMYANLFCLGYDLGQALTFFSLGCSRTDLLDSLRQIAHHAKMIGVDALPKKPPYLLSYYHGGDEFVAVTMAIQYETISQRLARLIAEIEATSEESWQRTKGRDFAKQVVEVRELLRTLFEANQPDFRPRP